MYWGSDWGDLEQQSMLFCVNGHTSAKMLEKQRHAKAEHSADVDG